MDKYRKGGRTGERERPESAGGVWKRRKRRPANQDNDTPAWSGSHKNEEGEKTVELFQSRPIGELLYSNGL